MSRPPIPAATVALIASAVIERRVKFGSLDQTDFTDYEIPGTRGQTFMERTLDGAAQEAWALVAAVERNRRPD